MVGYAMGTLYERKEAMTDDIRDSFSGLLLVLQHFMATEKIGFGENQRVVETSTKLAELMGLGADRVELMRSAVLLRDLGKLGISNDILYKAANMSRDEVEKSFHKGRTPDARMQAAGSALRRVIPIIVAQQIVAEQGARSVNVPIEAHILVVADAYEKLIGGLTGKALLPHEAEQEILAGAGQRFHSGVVGALGKVVERRAKGVGAS